MTPFLVLLHGTLGALLAAALLHPVLFLRGGRVDRRTRRAAAGAAFLALFQHLLGQFAYPAWRLGPRMGLLREDRLLLEAFEAKEHLAFVALVLVLVGAVLAWSGRARPTRGLLLAAFVLVLACWGVGAWTSIRAPV